MVCTLCSWDLHEIFIEKPEMQSSWSQSQDLDQELQKIVIESRDALKIRTWILGFVFEIHHLQQIGFLNEAVNFSIDALLLNWTVDLEVLL